MADKKLNEVTKVTDMAYVPVIMADGSIGQIAKADLASVVAGVMNTNKLFSFNDNGYSDGDFNNSTKTGSYEVATTNASNSPVGTTAYGIIVVFKQAHYITQIFKNVIKDETFIRHRLENGSWSEWQRIDNFGYNSLEDMANALKPLLGLS